MRLPTLVATLVAPLACVTVTDDVEEAAPVVSAAPSPPDWARVARVGGWAADAEMTDREIGLELNALVAQGVSVVEADSRLSEYLTDLEFAGELALMGRVARLAHERNLRVVWYGTSLEVNSIGGEAGRSIAKDHPDWLQRSWNGDPNVFYGSKVFWVEPGDESAWLSPRSGYREVFLHRVRRIAATGIDGFWLDVPLYNDVVGRWASWHPADLAQFTKDTGYAAPVVVGDGLLDPDDAATRAWLAWRHDEIDRFIRDAHAAALAVRPDFRLVVETVTMDYNAALLEGLDGAWQSGVERLHHVWEVDVLSDASGMRRAQAEDFYDLTTMYKFGRGVDGDLGGWAFAYGAEPDDAEVVLAACVSAGLSPYELKVPEMGSTVSEAFRSRLFAWVAANEDLLLRAPSAARVAVLHSSASRDVVERCVLTDDCGTGLYTSWENPAPGAPWWAGGEDDGVRRTQYLAEYRGVAQALLAAHVPFDVRPARALTSAPAARYDVIIAPSLAALSDEEGEVLRAFAAQGGQLLFTGEVPGRYGADGAERAEPYSGDAVVEANGDGASFRCTETPTGLGAVRYCFGEVGAAVRRYGALEAAEEVARFASRAAPVLELDAPPTVTAEVRTDGERLGVVLVNFSGADGSFEITPQSVGVRVYVGDRPVLEARARVAGAPDEALAVTLEAGWAHVALTVGGHALIELTLGP